MEKMPYQPLVDAIEQSPGKASTTIASEWQRGLPTLSDGDVVLRDLRAEDAKSLFALLTTEEVSRFISPPPSSLDGFERFIAWTQLQRAAGAYICFAVTLRGFDTAIGIIQVRQLELNFRSAEWGFAIGSPFWGTGVFERSAELVLDFAFDVLGVHRLEARAAVLNGRGNGALVKIGAVQEGILRRSLHLRGEHLDQVLYAILADDYHDRARTPSAPVQIH
jgi:ribosomal-protein-alanine N-acetyltransferase